MNWKKSMDIDFGARPRSAEGIHFANVGGMWQEIVLGFAGMVNALGAETLTFKPCMPKQIKSVVFQVIWKGQRVQITVTDNQLTLKNLSDSPITFYVHGKQARANPGEEATVAYGEAMVG
jgi:trehalose/maltose hydrolase-like predicted phosphorylase